MTSEAPERHKDTTRNKLLNQCLTDLDKIVNQHDPETDTSINNGVWGRLDKLSCDLEKHFTDHALAAREAREKQVREEALREGYQTLRDNVPEETTEPEYERGVAVGYRMALLDLISLIEGETDDPTSL